MIVASSFGLTLADGLQQDIPPFRDCYQNSVYFSTLLALSEGIKPDNSKIKKWLEEPRIFEIGRNGAFNLGVAKKQYIDDKRKTSDTEDKKEQALLGSFDVENHSIHPQSDKLYPHRYYFYGSFFCVVLFSILIYHITLNKGTNRLCSSKVFSYQNFYFYSILFILFEAFIDLDYLTIINLEPLSFTEGISIWPTEMIRVLAITLSALFLFAGKCDLEKNQKHLEIEFELSPLSIDPKYKKKWGWIFCLFVIATLVWTFLAMAVFNNFTNLLFTISIWIVLMSIFYIWTEYLVHYPKDRQMEV